MLAPAPGTAPMNSPIRLVHTTCQNRRMPMARPSRVSRQLAFSMRRLPLSVRIDDSSTMTRASEIANSPISTGISGILSNSSRNPKVARGVE